MLDVLCLLINESDVVSNELLDIILSNVLEPSKTQCKNAYQLAKDLVIKCSDTLEPYIQAFFNHVLILGCEEKTLTISQKVYDLIYELNHICPAVLLAVLPQLEFKLKSTDEKERYGSVSLLARMFSEPDSTLALNHKQLWTAFLGRFNDVSIPIRTKCVQYSMHFLLNHPLLRNDITETLKLRQHDSEENVRYEVVTAIVTTAKKEFSIVSDSEDLLNFVKERTLDKKFKIRKEAMCGLAMIYRKHLNSPNVPAATRHAVTWIKDKILHGYYMTSIDDRLLVERLLNTCLVPYQLGPEDRMKKLYYLFSTIDENASKAFIELQKHQVAVRKTVAELIEIHRKPQDDDRDREITYRLSHLTKFLPDPLKVQEYLRQFSKHLQTDRQLLILMKTIVSPEVTCKDSVEAVTTVLKKFGQPAMTNLYYNTIKMLLERVSSVMVDKVALQALLGLVHGAVTNDNSILEELNLTSDIATEKGLKLLLVLSFVYPAHFLHEDILTQLIGLLKLDCNNNNISPPVLSVLTYIGKHKPIGQTFPALWTKLIPICQEFAETGSPKQAKHAVRCLHTNCTNDSEAIFDKILDKIKEQLTFDSPHFRCAVVSLGHIAINMPEKFLIPIKNIVSRKIVKELLMRNQTPGHTPGPVEGDEWLEEEELTEETFVKMEGIKMMARWLLGLKSDVISAQKTFRMLNAFILHKGDLLETGKMLKGEMSQLRLSAGSAMLKICEQKGVGDQFTADQFYNLSQLMNDACPPVREKFAIKLHKGLAQGIPHKCLPLDFMGFYALAGLESDRQLRLAVRHYMIADISKRRDYIRTITMSGGSEKALSQLLHIMPDYMLVFAVPLLAHQTDFTDPADVAQLNKIRSCLWFILEPLMMKNDTYCFGFYKALIEQMKNHKDAVKPEDEITNQKLWAVCDLAMGLILSKTTSFEIKEFPSEPRIPPMYFKRHEDPNFVNVKSYLPAALQVTALKGSTKVLTGVTKKTVPSTGTVVTMKKTQNTSNSKLTDISAIMDKPSPISNFSERIKMKQDSPLLKSKIKMKRADSLSKETKNVLRNIPNKSKMFEIESSNMKQIKKAAVSREFNPTKFSTPSKNLDTVYHSQLDTASCYTSKPSIKEVKRGHGPASINYKSPRSLVCSPRALKKKLSSFQNSHPGENAFKKSHTSQIKDDTDNESKYSQSKLQNKVSCNKRLQPIVNNFIVNKTNIRNNNIRKISTDQHIIKKVKKSKSSLRNLQYKGSPSPGNFNNQPMQINKSRYANEEKKKGFVDFSLCKKMHFPKSINADKVKTMKSVSKEKKLQHSEVIDKNPNHSIISPQRKRKSVSETDQQENTLPSKKFRKENTFREFRGEKNVEKSPGKKNSKNVCNKGSDVTLTKSNFKLHEKKKVNKKLSKDNFSQLSESEDHGELNSSGYMSKASQNITYEDDCNNSTNESFDPNKYINLFYKDGKKINKNVLKRHSRILGEAIGVLNNCDLLIDLRLKKTKSIIDNYLDNPNLTLSLWESKFEKSKSIPNKNLELQNESPTSNSCELEQVEITMTVKSSDKSKYTVDKDKHLTPCTIGQDTIKEVKHKNEYTDSSPGKKLQSERSLYQHKELKNVCKKNNDNQKKSGTNLESENLYTGKNAGKPINSNQRNLEYTDGDTKFLQNTTKGKLVTNNSTLMNNSIRLNTNSSTSEDSSASSSSDSSSTEDELVTNELLDGKMETKTDEFNDTISSNHLDINPKHPLNGKDVIDISNKSNKLDEKILSDLDLSSESSEEEDHLKNSTNMKNINDYGHKEYLPELNSGNISEKKYNTIDSKEKVQGISKRRIVSLENTNDLRITIQGKNKEYLDEQNHDEILDQNGIYNSSQNLSLTSNSEKLIDEALGNKYSKICNSDYQLPWPSLLNDDLPLSENNSPPSSTKKQRISWNKRKEWDNDFQENTDELDDDHIEDIENDENSDNAFSEEEMVKDDKEYDTELDYEDDENSEEEEEKSQAHNDPSASKQRMINNVDVYDSSQHENAAVSERLSQDEDALSIHAESLFSQDENDGCCDDLGINDLQANSVIKTNSTIQANSTAQTNATMKNSAKKNKKKIQANSKVDETKDLHPFEENTELENVGHKNATSEVTREESKTIWEGMLSPQADMAEFNICAFPVSGKTHLFTENIADEIEVSALVEIHMVHSYLARRNSKSINDFVTVKFEPISSEDKQSYQDFLLHLLVNKQYAVIGNCQRRVKHFYVVPVPAQQSIPDVFLPLDGLSLKQCNYHFLIGIMIFSRHFAQGKNGDKEKLSSMGIPTEIEDKKKTKEENFVIPTLKKDNQTKDKNEIKEKKDIDNANSAINQVPYKPMIDDMNEHQNSYNANSDKYEVPYETNMDSMNVYQNVSDTNSNTFQVPYEPEMDDWNGDQTVYPEDYDTELAFALQLNERYQNLSASCAPEFYLNNDMSPTMTLSLLSNLIQCALLESREDRAWECFDRYVSNHPDIPLLGLEAMIPIARLILTSDVVLHIPENIKHYLDGAKVVVLCELSKGDEAYALFRVCYLYLPVTIKQTVTYSFIRFCGNHKVDDNESPWTKVQNWELENPSCILTEHQKAVKELLESTWLEFHIDSKNADKVWNIFMSLCSEMHKSNYFFKKLTIMVIDFFNDIGYAKMAYCVLDEVRRLQAADMEIFTLLIPLTFEPNISINLSSELIFTCDVIIELGVVLPKHDIEGLMKFFALIDKVDIAIKLAILGIKSSICIDITVIEEVVRKFDYMSHSLSKLYELLKILEYANLRFLKPSLNKVLNPTGHLRTSLNFHQNKLISNIQEYYREHVFISLKGDECQITPTKKDSDKLSYLSLNSPHYDEDYQKSLKERKCMKSPTKSTIRKLKSTEILDKATENKKEIESIYPNSLIMKSISSKEMDNQNDEIIKENTVNLVLSKDPNKSLEEMENVGSRSTIYNHVPYPMLSKNPSIHVEGVLESLPDTNEGVESITQPSLEHIEREKVLQEWRVSERLDKNDLQGNKLACVSISADIQENTKTNTDIGLKEKGNSSNSKIDVRNEQRSFNRETYISKPDSLSEIYIQEKHALSLNKNHAINDTNHIYAVDKLMVLKPKDVPDQVAQPKNQEPLALEKLSSPNKYSPMKHFKQSLKGATSNVFDSKNNDIATLQSEICGNQEQFSSPFGKRKIIKRTYSNCEQFKRQKSTSDNNQLQRLSVTVEMHHDSSAPTKRSVSINDKDNQIVCKPQYMNKDSISTDKIAQRALEILNKNRLLKNIPKHITQSQIMKKFQDIPQKMDCKLSKHDKEKGKNLELDSNTESQIPQMNYSRDPRLRRKISIEEYKMERSIQCDSNIKEHLHNNQETDSNDFEMLKEATNKDDEVNDTDNLELFKEKNNNEDLNDLSSITAVSSAGSTPPLEIDEELEFTNAEKLELESPTDEKMN